MLIVETIAKIRRLHFTEGKGIKTICRDLKLSKKVVRKVIRTGITEFTYTRTVQPRPKLGAWLGELNRLLEVNAARASRERQSLTQIYEVEGLPATGSRDSPDGAVSVMKVGMTRRAATPRTGRAIRAQAHLRLSCP